MTRNSSTDLYKTKQMWMSLILNLPFPPFIYAQSLLFNKKCLQELKRNNWKILTWPHLNKGNKHLAYLLCHLPVNWVFTMESNLFSFMARILTAFTWPPVYTEVVPMGRANHHLFYFLMQKSKLSRPCQNEVIFCNLCTWKVAAS